MKYHKLLVFVTSCLAQSAYAQAPEYPLPETRDAIGDWVLECYTVPPSWGQCQIYQRILADGGTSIAMVATFAASENGNVLAQIALPLGIDIDAGARFSIGAGYAARAPINRCTMQGCLVEGQMSPELIAQLQGANTASITVLDVDGSEFQIPISLDGFSEALDRLVRIERGASEGEVSEPSASAEPSPDVPRTINRLEEQTGGTPGQIIGSTIGAQGADR